jgi:hypothetical protein
MIATKLIMSTQRAQDLVQSYLQMHDNRISEPEFSNWFAEATDRRWPTLLEMFGLLTTEEPSVVGMAAEPAPPVLT